MNLIKYRIWFFAFSLAIIIPGLVALYLWGLRLGIDFAGGTLWEIKFQRAVTPTDIQKLLANHQSEISTISQSTQDAVLIRAKTVDESKINQIRDTLGQSYGQTEDIRLESVGPIISKELTKKAVIAVAISISAIVVYVTWAFRHVAKPASSIAFGICTIIALVHDVIVVVGVFAILGHFFAIEIDSLFITAILTVIGFSVHDTIVVFDRIRENLKKYSSYSFSEVVNHSILQTLARSLNTSLTVVFVLVAMLFFGGPSIRPFILALLIGITSGTYSSIANAAPLLVVWHNFRQKVHQ